MIKFLPRETAMTFPQKRYYRMDLPMPVAKAFARAVDYDEPADALGLRPFHVRHARAGDIA